MRISDWSSDVCSSDLTYGGACPHGGGAFSGKDPSKVDRSAAYAARYVAKNIVAAGLASQCQVQISYAIGVAEPINITVNTYGSGVISDEQISMLVREHFDLRPKGIINMLDRSEEHTSELQSLMRLS